MIQYTIGTYNPQGEFLTWLRWKAFDCTLIERGSGVLNIVLPPEYRDDVLMRDGRVALYRILEGRTQNSSILVGNTVWLMTQRRRVVNDAGEHSIILQCQHPNALLARRVVAYNEGTAQSKKSDLASEVLYAFINENFVAATDTARNVSSTHFVLDPDPNPAFGATTDTEGSYRSLLDIMQDVAQASAAQGAYIGWDVYVPSPPGPFRVRLYNRQKGTDRGLTSGQPIIIGPYTARMQKVEVGESWSDTISYAYAGGQGNLDERQVSTAEDTTLSAQSPFGRFERFESFNTNSTAMLTDNAYKMLRDFRPHRAFSATVVPYAEQTSGAVYDINYTHGDIVGAQFNAPYVRNGQLQSWITYTFNVRVNPVHLRGTRTYDEFNNIIGTEEQVEISLQSVDSS